MNALSPLLSRPELLAAVPTPGGLEALPSWLRLVVAHVVAQVLEGERCAQLAAHTASQLERTPEGRAFAARQRRDEARHVAFFVETQARLGPARAVDPDVAALFAKASRATGLCSILLSTHLVIETLGHALFDASAALLTAQSTNRLFSAQTRTTLLELGESMERLQGDESQHLGYGILRLREERALLDPEGQARFDAEVAAWRSELATLFARLPMLKLLQPWLGLRPASVLAAFDARARAIGARS
jgi:hypothetical protein